MTNAEAAEILGSLLRGTDPETGEILPEDHACAQVRVMRALYLAILALQKAEAGGEPKLYAGRSWTPEDDVRLRSLAGAGETVEAICAQLGRRPRGVEGRMLDLHLMTQDECRYAAHKASMGNTHAFRRWTPEDDALLTRMFREEDPPESIEDALGRTRAGIAARLVRLGLIECRRDFSDASDQEDGC